MFIVVDGEKSKIPAEHETLILEDEGDVVMND